MRVSKYVFFLALLFSFFTANFGRAQAADSLKDLNANTVEISGRKNAVLLFFWTTWCPYCRSEIKVLNKNYEEIKKEGITVFAINVAESSSKVKRYFRDSPVSFKVLLDENAKIATKFAIVGVPTYILIDKTGKILLKENRLPADYKALLKR